jgi:hypothetical protein
VAFTLAVTYSFKSVLYESHRRLSYEELLLVYVLSCTRLLSPPLSRYLLSSPLPFNFPVHDSELFFQK